MAAAILKADPQASAKRSNLRYVSDDGQGITRRRCGKGFAYYDAQGRLIRDGRTLGRIRSLAIPPAWRDVWICPTDDGHLQATGRDDRGRKQYRYHPRWSEVRGQRKFDQLVHFAQALPRIRQAVAGDLARPGLPRRKVLAAVVQLLDRTAIRVGNEAYRKANDSYGLTTLRRHHVEVNGTTLRFEFRAKGGQWRELAVRDRKLARLVRRCQELDGHELFQYRDGDGEVRDVDSGDVNDYLRDVAGLAVTSKHFRTWAGTIELAIALQEIGPANSPTAAKRNVVAAVKQAAGHLGNRPATCRKYYVHPAVIEAYMEGAAVELPSADACGVRESYARCRASCTALCPQERALLRFLRRRCKLPVQQSAG